MMDHPDIVLIVTLGSEPQVVTSTLDLLLAKDVLVRKVCVLHTSPPEGPIQTAITALKDDFYHHQYDNNPALEFHPILKQNIPVKDVETIEDSEAGFRAIFGLVHKAKYDGNIVHLSIAGGRKNLAIFGMVAAQLLFDERDCLWHLYSSGEYLASKRLHPEPGDQVHLLPIPVLLREYISPALTHLRNITDPFVALARIEQLDLNRKYEQAASFVNGTLTGAERRVVSLLVQEGVSDFEIAERLYLSPRTVEQHLRSAYSKAADHWELERVNRAQLVALLNAYFSLPGVEKLRENPQDKRKTDI